MTVNMRLELFVKDLQRSVDFYKNVLQLELSSQNENSAMFKAENLHLLLTQEDVLSSNHYFKEIKDGNEKPNRRRSWIFDIDKINEG